MNYSSLFAHAMTAQLHSFGCLLIESGFFGEKRLFAARYVELARLQVRDKEKEAVIADLRYRNNLLETRLQTLVSESSTP